MLSRQEILNFLLSKDIRRLLKRKGSDASETGRALEELRSSMFNSFATSEKAKNLQQRLCTPSIALSFNFFIAIAIIFMNKWVGAKECRLPVPRAPQFYSLRGNFGSDRRPECVVFDSALSAVEIDPFVYSRTGDVSLHRSCQCQLEVQQRRVLSDGKDCCYAYYCSGRISVVQKESFFPQGGCTRGRIDWRRGCHRDRSAIQHVRCRRCVGLDCSKCIEQDPLVQSATTGELDCLGVNVEDDADIVVLSAYYDSDIGSSGSLLLQLEFHQHVHDFNLRSFRLLASVVSGFGTGGNISHLPCGSWTVQNMRAAAGELLHLPIESGHDEHRRSLCGDCRNDILHVPEYRKREGQVRETISSEGGGARIQGC
ncbi:hypothetical protein GQ457_12G025270 [Hibiscus cannabinus]